MCSRTRNPCDHGTDSQPFVEVRVTWTVNYGDTFEFLRLLISRPPVYMRSTYMLHAYSVAYVNFLSLTSNYLTY